MAIGAHFRKVQFSSAKFRQLLGAFRDDIADGDDFCHVTEFGVKAGMGWGDATCTDDADA
jgi:hypothetical protein